MRPLLSSVLIAGALLAPAVPLAAPNPPPFVVALVRDDGVMLPIASHDRGRWRMPWPAPAKEAEVPVRVEDCPLAWWGLPAAPREWTLHVPGEAPRTVTADRMTWVRTYCRQQVALHSRDATRPLLRLPDGARAPKYGVAVAGPAEVTLPRSVAPDSDEARQLLDGLQHAFNREERLMFAQDYFAVFEPSVAAEDRDRLPVTGALDPRGPGTRGADVLRRTRAVLSAAFAGAPALVRRGHVHVGLGATRCANDTLDLTLLTRAVTSCLFDTTQRAEPHVIVHTPQGPVWMLDLYRPDAEVVGLFRAPQGEDPEPILIREIGRCVEHAAAQPARAQPAGRVGAIGCSLQPARSSLRTQDSGRI